MGLQPLQQRIAWQPRASHVCAGLKGIPWWLTVDVPADPENAASHCEGAQALTAKESCISCFACLRVSSPRESLARCSSKVLACERGDV